MSYKLLVITDQRRQTLLKLAVRVLALGIDP